MFALPPPIMSKYGTIYIDDYRSFKEPLIPILTFKINNFGRFFGCEFEFNFFKCLNLQLKLWHFIFFAIS